MVSNIRHWVFLRGLARHSNHWGPFLEAFQKFFPKDSLELLDIRGNGEMTNSSSCLSIAENVHDLRDRCKAIGAGHPIYLLTLSMGGMIGVEWAQQFPQEIQGLVLINSSDRGSSHFYQRLKVKNWFKILKLMISKKSRLDIERTILEITTRNIDIEAWAQNYAKMPPTSKINFLRQLLAAKNYSFPDKKPACEILLLNSLGDDLVDPHCSQNIAAQWNLNLISNPSAGHDIPLDDSTWICQQIQSWRASD